MRTSFRLHGIAVCIPVVFLTSSILSQSLPQSEVTIERKAAIEQHFLGKRPVPDPLFDGATPGAALLQQAASRPAEISARANVSDSAQVLPSTVHPLTASSPSVLPGLMTRPALPAGNIPTAVATGDFNRDGKADFVVANGKTDDLWIYFGIGDGTFQLPRIVPLTKGVSPVAIVAADLRGNGTLDLVVAEYDTATVGVLLGNGDGTFQYEQTIPMVYPPTALVVGDFDHDGKADIAAALYTAGTTAYSSGATYSGSGTPWFTIAPGKGDGAFGTPIVTAKPNPFTALKPWTLASGDLNGDGNLDLIAATLTDVRVFFGKGDGGFTEGPTPYGDTKTAPTAARIADLDGDGCQDVAVADLNSYVYLIPGDCSGGFKATVQAASMGDSNTTLNLVDVNGDGRLDLVTGSIPALSGSTYSAGNSLNVAFGDGRGHYLRARTYRAQGNTYAVASADFNGDGKLDVVSVANDTNMATIYTNDGTGAFGGPEGIGGFVDDNGTSFTSLSRVSFADINTDGYADAIGLAICGSHYCALTFMSDAAVRLKGVLATDSGITSLSGSMPDNRLGDFRGSGRKDVVFASTSTSTPYLAVLPSNGDGTFGQPIVTTDANAAGTLTVGDFNGDGKLDLVVVRSGVLIPYMGKGDGTFLADTQVTFGSSSVGIDRVYAADINRDGKLDVLVYALPAGSTSSTLFTFSGNGDGTFGAARQLSGFGSRIAAGDLNGDGSLDLVEYASTNSASVSNLIPSLKTYIGQSDGSFSAATTYMPYLGSFAANPLPFGQSGDPLTVPAVGDMNADGRPDVLVVQAFGAYGQILATNSDGTLTPTYDKFLFSTSNAPDAMSDMNHDGFADFIQVDKVSNAVNVIPGARAPALQISLVDAVVHAGAGCGYIFVNAASSTDRTAMLSSTVSGVVLPGSVTVPAKATSAQFCFTLSSGFDTGRVFDVTGSLDGDSATAYGSAEYIAGFSLNASVTSDPVYLGTGKTVNLTITSASGYATQVKLACVQPVFNSTCQFPNDTITVGAGQTVTVTGTLQVPASYPISSSQSNSITFVVQASDANVTERKKVTFPVVSPLYISASDTSALIVSSPGTVSRKLTVNGIPPYTLNCSGGPPGTTCNVAETLPESQSTSTTVNATVPLGAAPGSYQLNVNAASGSLTASYKISMSVISFSLGTLSSSSSWLYPGASNVTVSIPVQGSSNMSGTLNVTCTFSVGTCSGSTPQITSGSGTAQVVLSVPAGLSLGQYALGVTATFGTVTSTANLPIYVSDISGSASSSTSSSSITMGRSGSSTFNVALSGSTGFDATVTLGCTTSDSTAVQCSLSQTSVALTAGTSKLVTGTLSSSATASLDQRGRRPAGPWFVLLVPCGLLLYKRRRITTLLMAFMVAVVLLGMSSCSGGGSSNGGSSNSTPQSNSYTVTVTAATPGAAAKAIATIPVTVTH